MLLSWRTASKLGLAMNANPEQCVFVLVTIDVSDAPRKMNRMNKVKVKTASRHPPTEGYREGHDGQ